MCVKRGVEMKTFFKQFLSQHRISLLGKLSIQMGEIASVITFNYSLRKSLSVFLCLFVSVCLYLSVCPSQSLFFVVHLSQSASIRLSLSVLLGSQFLPFLFSTRSRGRYHWNMGASSRTITPISILQAIHPVSDAQNET